MVTTAEEVPVRFGGEGCGVMHATGTLDIVLVAVFDHYVGQLLLLDLGRRRSRKRDLLRFLD